MSELANKTKKELLKMVSEKREALRVFRFSVAGGKIKNIKEASNLKKDIARIFTALNANKEVKVK